MWCLLHSVSAAEVDWRAEDDGMQVAPVVAAADDDTDEPQIEQSEHFDTLCVDRQTGYDECDFAYVRD